VRRGRGCDVCYDGESVTLGAATEGIRDETTIEPKGPKSTMITLVPGKSFVALVASVRKHHETHHLCALGGRSLLLMMADIMPPATIGGQLS